MKNLILFFFGTLLFINPSYAVEIEVQTASLPAVTSPVGIVGNGLTFIPFFEPFTSIPVVIALGPNDNTDPSTIQIGLVTETGFWAAVREPSGEDAFTPAQNFTYIAAEKGVNTLPDGSVIEVGTQMTNAIQHGSGVSGTESWDNLTFQHNFTVAPAVITGIQTVENETNPVGQVSCPWLTQEARSVTTTGMQIALGRAEAAPCTVPNAEEYGYIALDRNLASSFTTSNNEDVKFSTRVTPNEITGTFNGTCDTVSIGQTFSSPPLVLGSKVSLTGGDGGWFRFCSAGTTTFQINVEEDEYRDIDSHPAQEAGAFFFFTNVFSHRDFVFDKEWRATFRDGVNQGVANAVRDGDEVVFRLFGEGIGTMYDIFEPMGWNLVGVFEDDLTTPYPNTVISAEDVDSDSENETVIQISTVSQNPWEVYVILEVAVQ